MATEVNVGFVLSCMDYSLVDKTIELLKNECCMDEFDHFILAGASLGYNQCKYPDWKTAFTEHLDLAIEMHNIKKIIVLEHEGCSAYGMLYEDDDVNIYNENSYHFMNMIQFVNTMQELYPDIPVECYLLPLNE